MRALFMNRKAMLTVLAAVSLLLYGLDYILLDRNFKELSVRFLGNLAFLPLYVIIVTMMLEQVIRERERQTLMRKLNMVIGVFFSEVGNRLLRELSPYVVSCDGLRTHLLVNGSWKEQEFRAAHSFLDGAEIRVDCSCCDKEKLKQFMVGRRAFLVGLLENQNLLEHEQFTDLLWAVFHLMEELEARENFENMSAADTEHINGDIKRAYGYLSHAWLSYMQHLKSEYPYLFSLAIRLNPMIENPDPHLY
ncbi:MAG: hypothetical protein HY888_03945 [Deltaproteobacteria bacterium]|nr:hypothetical protein [Deltaproteobacteria bacterium]